ncbi:Ankyrin repeat domain protein [Wolbachia endosymbiont of Drosophila simulans wNo]|uniref:ankyrin repeat domain-containing protein n=1 Tax=Wolbachia endosymbiont of Drosophila simulans TaxID=77038 RepID=UPI0002D2573B|nr:ankyrin repeat domain-containing protein [Wolbachia endosymbiont of Drosophila simulans]AGJ99263.1 Ankyrin repeat domain protein [Wolbachia endosymbiont of Drosophila simulans wNo]
MYPEALRFAARNGHEGVVKVLLRTKGIDIKTLSEELGLAAENGYEGVVKALLTAEQVDVDRYFSALYFAAANGREGIVKALLTAEQISVSEKDSFGKTTLHWAAERGHIEILNTLLGKKASVNIKDNYGETPLHYAAKNGHIEIVKILLAVDGIDINVKDKDEKTPFDLAKTEEIKALLKKAAEKTDDSSVSTDSEGDQEKDAGQEGNVQPSLQEQKEESQELIAEEISDVQIEDADNGHSIDIALTKNGVNPRSESSTNEEHPSSFFDNLLNIIMKPFSLIGSFFGGFFSWLFGSDQTTGQEPLSNSVGDESSTKPDQTTMQESPSNSGGEELKNYQEGDNNII